jgi:hypothetical protein
LYAKRTIIEKVCSRTGLDLRALLILVAQPLRFVPPERRSNFIDDC